MGECGITDGLLSTNSYNLTIAIDETFLHIYFLSKQVYWILILLIWKTAVLWKNDPVVFLRSFREINVDLKISIRKQALCSSGLDSCIECEKAHRFTPPVFTRICDLIESRT